MKTFKRYMKAIGNKLESGAPFGWDCYGVEARYYDVKGPNDWEASMIADSVTREVFEITLTHGISETALRWVNPKYKKALKAESEEKGFSWKQAWDDIEYKEVSKKKILKTIDLTFSGKYIILKPYYDEVQVSPGIEPTDLSDVHTNELFRIYALEETADGGMKVDCYIAPQVVERIVNEWIVKVLDEKIEETLRSETAAREVAEKEGGSSDTVEKNEVSEDVSRTDWSGSFTYPHER